LTDFFFFFFFFSLDFVRHPVNHGRSYFDEGIRLVQARQVHGNLVKEVVHSDLTSTQLAQFWGINLNRLDRFFIFAPDLFKEERGEEEEKKRDLRY
jgi:hypothetical protein